jgi:hypothetical protein
MIHFSPFAFKLNLEPWKRLNSPDVNTYRRFLPPVFNKTYTKRLHSSMQAIIIVDYTLKIADMQYFITPEISRMIANVCYPGDIGLNLPIERRFFHPAQKKH